MRVAALHYVNNQINRPIQKVCHNDRGCCHPNSKAITRRNMKRAARAILKRFDQEADGV